MNFWNSHPEISYLILKLLNNPDLSTLCRVSKSFYMLAGPLLYRSVILPEYFDWYPLRCLLEDQKKYAREWVQELTVERTGSIFAKDREKQVEERVELLMKLIKSLPNLRDLYLDDTHYLVPLTPHLIETICNHQQMPNLHLICERATTQGFSLALCVRTLRMYLHEWYRATWNLERLALHEILAAFPRLQDLSVSIRRSEEVKDVTVPRRSKTDEGIDDRIVPFISSARTLMHPLESLSLDGYIIRADEVIHWEKGFPWSTLKSLRLGPRDSGGFFGAIGSSPLSLKEFAISTYYNWSNQPSLELEAFLLSFDTLEILDVRGYSRPSLSVVANHRGLKHLCLHEVEIPDEPKDLLPLLEEIKNSEHLFLDLEYLQLDIGLQDGEWPRDYISAIMARAVNLKYLRFHIEVGLKSFNPYPCFGHRLRRRLTQSVQKFEECISGEKLPLKLREMELISGEKRFLPVGARDWQPEHEFRILEADLKRNYLLRLPLAQDGFPRFDKIFDSGLYNDDENETWSEELSDGSDAVGTNIS